TPTMEFWFIILLSLIAVLAIALLLFLELMGDDAVRFRNIKHKRGDYINDQTAVICQTIKDTLDSKKAYSLFIEYIFINNKQFLEFVKRTLEEISRSYNDGDMESLDKCVQQTKEMRIELKDQMTAQNDCIATIDNTTYIESAAWLHLSNDCRFSVNDGIRNMAKVCIEYPSRFSEPFPEIYGEQLEYLLGDICNICDTCLSLIGTTDISGMRELRKRMSVILDESYANTQRLYELLHDGRSDLENDKRIALQYAMNAFQELHCMIYTLRRFVLANLCMTLSIMTKVPNASSQYPSSPIRND
ncbi:MAG: hypothetical protein K2J58_03425, partial [Muribaculaceae bacterium]|nr:hypothetical protein [Muribaculaceae bacterium]